MLRTALSIVIPLLLLAPLAYAGQESVLEDAVGDETIMPFTSSMLREAPDCEAPAADIRQLLVASSDEELRVTLVMGSLDDPEADCGPFDLESPSAYYAVILREEYTDDPLAQPTEVGLRARLHDGAMTGCAVLYLSDASPADCLGAFAVEGDALVWTLPIAGAATVWACEDVLCLLAHEETRAYDLRGLSVERRASARIDFADAASTPYVAMRDTLAGGFVTL